MDDEGNLAGLQVFPAHAGVIRMNAINVMGSESFPRTRGGDPWSQKKKVAAVMFSPHTRG